MDKEDEFSYITDYTIDDYALDPTFRGLDESPRLTGEQSSLELSIARRLEQYIARNSGRTLGEISQDLDWEETLAASLHGLETRAGEGESTTDQRIDHGKSRHDLRVNLHYIILAGAYNSHREPKISPQLTINSDIPSEPRKL